MNHRIHRAPEFFLAKAADRYSVLVNHDVQTVYLRDAFQIDNAGRSRAEEARIVQLSFDLIQCSVAFNGAGGCVEGDVVIENINIMNKQ